MNEDEFNIYGLLAVLELLRNSQKFLDAYIEKYKDNETDAMSYSVDPHCKCRDNLVNHYNSNSKDVNDFTRNFITNNSTELDWVDFVRRNQTTPVAGKIVTIPKNPEDYATLVQQMHNERWVFRHMNVAVDGDSYVFFFA